MSRFLLSVGVLNFTVNFFLLMATNRLTDQPIVFWKTILASAIGGIYGSLCLLPEYRLLGNALWRLVVLWLMCFAAWGWGKGMLCNGVLFLLFHLALTGIATLKEGGIGRIIVTAAVLAVLCFALFQNRRKGLLVPVELIYGNQKISFVALKDTGNTLRDPVTGQTVLVVDGEISQILTGMTQTQLEDPIKSMQTHLLPGLRLIPYHALGNSNGLLLAMRIPKVRIGSWQGSSIVAFAPHKFQNDGKFQALTGGNL